MSPLVAASWPGSDNSAVLHHRPEARTQGRRTSTHQVGRYALPRVCPPSRAPMRRHRPRSYPPRYLGAVVTRASSWCLRIPPPKNACKKAACLWRNASANAPLLRPAGRDGTCVTGNADVPGTAEVPSSPRRRHRRLGRSIRYTGGRVRRLHLGDCREAKRCV